MFSSNYNLGQVPAKAYAKFKKNENSIFHFLPLINCVISVVVFIEVINQKIHAFDQTLKIIIYVSYTKRIRSKNNFVKLFVGFP